VLELVSDIPYKYLWQSRLWQRLENHNVEITIIGRLYDQSLISQYE